MELEDSTKYKVAYYNNGNIRHEAWHDAQGLYNRINTPAKIVYYPNGTIQKLVWRRRGVFYNKTGPCRQVFNEDGTIRYQRWSSNPNSFQKTYTMKAFPMFSIYKIMELKVKDILISNE